MPLPKYVSYFYLYPGGEMTWGQLGVLQMDMRMFQAWRLDRARQTSFFFCRRRGGRRRWAWGCKLVVESVVDNRIGILAQHLVFDMASVSDQAKSKRIQVDAPFLEKMCERMRAAFRSLYRHHQKRRNLVSIYGDCDAITC